METENNSPVQIAEGYLHELVRESHLVFIGTVLSLGKPPLDWSGYGSAYQTVNYKVEKILKGQHSTPEIAINHVVVYGSKTAQQGETPGLSPDLFAVNAKLIVSAQKTQSGVWKALAEDTGALPATQEWLQKMESAILAK